jgi:NAD(P)H-quinone oxidoreductase subunit 5
MGFMIVECGLGLYTLAALHLIGHSLYKAHSFLSASTVVRQTRLQAMGGTTSPISISLFFAPVIAIPLVLLIQLVFSSAAWPWWWSVVLGLAWSPLLWLPMQRSTIQDVLLYEFYGALMIVGLTSAALVAHTLPLDLYDTPNNLLGVIVLMGMAMLYVCLGLLQKSPQLLKTWRRWSYAGFYMDEVYTRLSLKIWPTRWNP